ncbi:MAG: ABC transporter permease [Bacteroidia bacterium]
MERFLFNFLIGLEALIANRFRAILTSLGIIFGVAAVIAMLAIGAGTEREILEQIRQIGSNNIIIKARVIKRKQSDEEQKTGNETARYSPGLSMADAANILESVPEVNYVSPEIEKNTRFFSGGLKTDGRLIGVSNRYFESNNLRIAEGMEFSDLQSEDALAVCIIGKGVKARLFADEEPIGKLLKCDGVWLRVTGVLENREVSQNASQKFSIRNVNNDVYVPVNTMLLRFFDRSFTSMADIRRMAASDEDEEGNTSQSEQDDNYHQLDRLVVNMTDSKHMDAAVEIIGKMLQRRHNQVEDFEIVVPELLLKQEQRTRKLFNIVLAVIAGISLLVGGIGIMNIMLASVLERTKEIGLRLSIGARRRDIVYQFVAEAVLISLSGGIAGIILGIVLAYAIESIADIQTIISGVSVAVSFVVSVSVGLLFGIYPARRASNQSPMESLRYE